MMKFFSAFSFLLLVSLAIYAEKIEQVVDWDSYKKESGNFQSHIPFWVQIQPTSNLKNSTLTIADILWVPITDTSEINRLKGQTLRPLSNTATLFFAAGKQTIEASIDPLRKEGDIFYRAKSFNVEIKKGSPSLKSVKTYSSQSVLASGSWIKLASTTAGIQKIAYTKLKEWGISTPSNVAVYSNSGYMLPKMNNVDYPDDLTKIPVLHSKDKNGNDCIFFFSTGPTQWKYDSLSGIFVHTLNLYSDSTYFFLSSDANLSDAPAVEENVSTTPDTILNSYTALGLYEKENINLILSGRRWFSDIIVSNSRQTNSFTFPSALTNKKATLTIACASKCSSSAYSVIKINDSFSDTIRYNPVYESDDTEYADIQETNILFPSRENTTVVFNYAGESGTSWLDYLSFNVPSSLVFSGSQLQFRSPESTTYETVKYDISTSNKNTVLWDITNPLNPKQMITNTESNIVSFTDNGRSLKEYILFDPVNGSFSEPSLSGKVQNQNIHGLPSYEMIIVTHPNFMEQSKSLAEYHRQTDNLSVLVLTTNEIYNEFSSGLPDVSGIRNMLRFFYSRNENSATPLRYALLMGDGSYDNHHFDGTKNNFIPTYQSDNSIIKTRSYVMDDYYGLLDDNEGESKGLMDIGIGRIPCTTTTEAENIINKIKMYSSVQSQGEWRNIICFAADDYDNGGSEFMSNSEELNNLINQKYNGFYTKKIYFDSYQQISTSGGNSFPDVTTDINQSINDGALIFNYIGHANPKYLANEKVLEINDILKWNNSRALPLFVTATCEFGRFDGDDVSAGEQVLLNPNGGGIGLFTTTRMVYSSNNQNLSKNFFSNIFKLDENEDKLRLGDVMKNAKNSTNDTNKFNFSLLADPALRLSFPKYKVVTKTINNAGIDTTEITIGALDKVTIKGEVVDNNGSLRSNFNGDITTTIYDKPDTVETLNNDGDGSYKYPVQNNVIYKGSASVTNGEFELSFIVPKDISYNVGQGRILYYTSNGEDDGNGSTTHFNIGGSSANPVIDNNAPEMGLYINNENFKSYDKVSSNVLLLVNLFDESGINTVGTGIGHDLVAVLDSDYTNQLVLNEFYSSEQNSYQRGKIIYPISNLTPGKHKIWVKVWDIQNNSTEKEIYFIVEDGFKITKVQPVPNPVSVYTDFDITHNLPGETFDVTIDIYNLAGQRIDQVEETISSNKTTDMAVRWNVYESSIPLYSNQMLVYRVTLKNQEGLSATGVGRLLLNLKN